MPNFSSRWQQAVKDTAIQQDINGDKDDVLNLAVALNATPSEAATWVQANVTDIASAKQALIVLVKIVFFIILILRQNGLLDDYLE